MSKSESLRALIIALFLTILFYSSAQVTALDNDSETSQIATPSPTETPSVTITVVTPTATMTHTPTPSSFPGVPTLFEPQNGAVLPQPVAPNEWLFTWSARNGPCTHKIHITNPYQQTFSTSTQWYVYHYQTTEYIPDNALGPWLWKVDVICPLGQNTSETRSFYVEAGPPGIPTWTLSATANSTPTFTSTVSSTPTLTATASSTPTFTATESSTPTLTDTPSSTPTFTATPSATPTTTPSQTSTPTTTLTSTSTVTAPPACLTRPEKPEIIYPINGTQVDKKKIILDWDDSPCAKFYIVLVRKNSKLGPILMLKARLVKSQSPFMITTYNTRFVWRVAACNRFGCVWSGWNRFRASK